MASAGPRSGACPGLLQHPSANHSKAPLFRPCRSASRPWLHQSHTAAPVLPKRVHFRGPAPPSAANVEPSDPGMRMSGPEDSNQPDNRPPLVKLLAKIKLPEWATSSLKGISVAEAISKQDARALSILKMAAITAAFFLVAMAREAFVAKHQVVPKEVLYSSMVTLLDNGRVRAARLESATGRLYFDLKPQPAAAEDADAPSTSSAAAAATTASTSTLPGDGRVRFTRQVLLQHMVRKPPKFLFESWYRWSVNVNIKSCAGIAHDAMANICEGKSLLHLLVPCIITAYYVKLADKNDMNLVQRILAAGVEYAVIKASFQTALANTFLSALAIWLPLTPLFFLVRKLLDERNGTRKKRANMNAQNVVTTFADVAGVDSAKQELMEVVSVMKAAKQAYSRLKVKMPSGVLLAGPPGTGKTLLAKAVAGEAGIPFIAVSASEFVELFVGRGAARIRELFAEARKVAPCVVFIDELDAVGSRRGMGYNDERDQTLNQLLTELDGFEGRPGVLFLAATNRIDVLDPALLRPGRISRKVTVPLPDEVGRRDILAVHLRGIPLVEPLEEACARVAKVTAGFCGAELANVVNEASLLAARNNQEYVTVREMLEGVQRTKFGVDGRSQAGGAVKQSMSNWLLNMAQYPQPPRVRTATS